MIGAELYWQYDG